MRLPIIFVPFPPLWLKRPSWAHRSPPQRLINAIVKAVELNFLESGEAIDSASLPGTVSAAIGGQVRILAFGSTHL